MVGPGGAAGGTGSPSQPRALWLQHAARAIARHTGMPVEQAHTLCARAYLRRLGDDGTPPLPDMVAGLVLTLTPLEDALRLERQLGENSAGVVVTLLEHLKRTWNDLDSLEDDLNAVVPQCSGVSLALHRVMAIRHELHAVLAQWHPDYQPEPDQ